MPDLVTHLCGARLLRRWTGAALFPLFVLGATLPDILSRPFHILFPAAWWYLAPMHSPFVLLLVAALISLLFVSGIRSGVFLSLCAGAALHLFFDLFQKQLCPVYFWLYPFSWRSWWAGLFWPDEALMALPLTLLVTALVVLRERKAAGRGAGSSADAAPSARSGGRPEG